MIEAGKKMETNFMIKIVEGEEERTYLLRNPNTAYHCFCVYEEQHL